MQFQRMVPLVLAVSNVAIAVEWYDPINTTGGSSVCKVANVPGITENCRSGGYCVHWAADDVVDYCCIRSSGCTHHPVVFGGEIDAVPCVGTYCGAEAVCGGDIGDTCVLKLDDPDNVALLSAANPPFIPSSGAASTSSGTTEPPTTRSQTTTMTTSQIPPSSSEPSKRLPTPTQTQTVTGGSSPGLPTGAIVGISVGVVVIILIAAYIWKQRSTRKKAKATSPGHAPPPQSGWAMEPWELRPEDSQSQLGGSTVVCSTINGVSQSNVGSSGSRPPPSDYSSLAPRIHPRM